MRTKCTSVLLKIQFCHVWKSMCILELNVAIFRCGFFLFLFKVYKATGEEFLKIAGGKWLWSQWHTGVHGSVVLVLIIVFFPGWGHKWIMKQLCMFCLPRILDPVKFWFHVVGFELWAFGLWCSQTGLAVWEEDEPCSGSTCVPCSH